MPGDGRKMCQFQGRVLASGRRGRWECRDCSVEKSTWVWKNPDCLLNPVLFHDPLKVTSDFWSFCLHEVFR